LLGTGDSGKSTFLRQIQHISDPGCLDKDSTKFSIVLKRNCHESMVDFIKLLKKTGYTHS